MPAASNSFSRRPNDSPSPPPIAARMILIVIGVCRASALAAFAVLTPWIEARRGRLSVPICDIKVRTYAGEAPTSNTWVHARTAETTLVGCACVTVASRCINSRAAADTASRWLDVIFGLRLAASTSRRI